MRARSTRRWKEQDIVKNTIPSTKLKDNIGPNEDEIQISIVEYVKWKYPTVKFTYTMGDVRLSPKQAVKAKKMGYCKGISDIIFFKACHGYHGLGLELKRDKHSRVRKEQIEWRDYLNEQGYFAYIASGYEESIEIIDRYLG